MRSIINQLKQLNWKYILGEVTLIVIGILVAVQINNWNGHRKSRNFEKQIMIEIYQTFQKDLDIINSRIKRCQTIEKATAKAYQHLIDKAPLTDELQQSFWLCNWVVFFQPQTIAFERLRAKGIELVSDDQLRIKLLHLHDYRYPKLQTFTNRLNTWTETALKPFAQETFSIESFQRSKKRYIPLDYNQLIEDPHFRNLILDKQSRTRDMLHHLKLAAEELTALMSHIEEQYHISTSI